MPLLAPKLPKLPPLDFSGQTAIVTGTTNGLGLAVSEELLRHRLSRLIMGVRTVSRGEALKSQLLSDREIRAASPGAKIDVLELDLEDYKSVVAFADRVKQMVGSVDIVLLNAGTGGLRREMTASGHEKMIQVNVLSNALLGLEMLPLLESTAAATGRPSRLTWVGSFVQEDHTLSKTPIAQGETVLGHFDDEKNFSSLGRYNDSKLLTTMLVKEMAQHVDKKKVIFNEVSPGPVSTNFGSNYPFVLKVMFMALLALKARSPKSGASTYLHAIAVAGEDSHGEYLSDNKIARRAAIVSTPEGQKIQKKLWKEVLDECKQIDPRITLV